MSREPVHNDSIQRLVEIAKNYNKEGKLPKDAPKEVTILDVLDQTASVKLVAEWGVDYMRLAKFDGEWMIVNVLWQSQPKNRPLKGSERFSTKSREGKRRGPR
jgi:Putative lumazine-binding